MNITLTESQYNRLVEVQELDEGLLNTIGDIVGIFDPTGLVDLLNAMSYWKQGKNTFALLSLVSVIPGIDWATKPFVLGGKVIKGLSEVAVLGWLLKTFGKWSGKAFDFLDKLLLSKIPFVGRFVSAMKSFISGIKSNSAVKMTESKNNNIFINKNKMKKIVTLTEADLTRIVRRVMKETVMQPEPVPTGVSYGGRFAFDEGLANMTNQTKLELQNEIASIIKPSISTIRTFINSKFPLPNMFTINVGTSHSGNDEVNARVAQQRLDLLKSIVINAIKSFGIGADAALQLWTKASKTDYQPTKFDFDFYDETKVKPNDKERFGYLKISPITTMGLKNQDLLKAAGKVTSPDIKKTIHNEAPWYDIFNLSDSYTTYIIPDEMQIYKGVRMLQTYSDVEELNTQLKAIAKKNLADIINSKITNAERFSNACMSLKKAFNRSNKPTSLIDCRRVGDLFIEFE